MKVLYLHQYFKTPKEGGAIRSYYLAKGLIENGYEVEMVTAHNHNKYKFEDVDGIRTHYLPVSYSNHFRFFARILAFVKFTILAYRFASKIPNVDICYATSSPLTVGLTAIRLKKKFGIPYFFEVRDLWPEAPIQMGAIKWGFLKKRLYRLEKRIYNGADKIVALSPGIRNGIDKIAPGSKVHVIPNMADTSFFQKEGKQPSLEQKFNVEDHFVITYFGAVGKVNHLEYFIDFVEAFKNKRFKVSFLVAGQGSELERIKLLAEEKKLTKLRFIPYQNKDGLKEVMNITDAVYISFADRPVLETNSPNKYFDALAAGKVTLINTKGWIKETTETHRCGFYADPIKPMAMVNKTIPLIRDKSLLYTYQNNARNLAELYYSREIQVQKLLKVFDNEHKMNISDPSVYILTA